MFLVSQKNGHFLHCDTGMAMSYFLLVPQLLTDFYNPKLRARSEVLNKPANILQICEKAYD